MNNREFLAQLLQTNDASVIQDIIDQNPYFEAAHLAKALHSKDEKDLHNASLLLQNELWMQYLLAQSENDTIKEVEVLQAVTNISERTFVDENILKANTTVQNTETLTEAAIPTIDNDVVGTAAVQEAETLTEAAISAIDTEVVETTAVQEAETLTEAVLPTIDTEVLETTAVQELETLTEAAMPAIENEVVETAAVQEAETLTEAAIPTIDTEVVATTAAETEANNTEIEVGAMAQENEIIGEGVGIKKEDAEALKNIVSAIKENKADENPEAAFSIEPYHTIDYFASQGIKQQQLLGNDKLSIQLKSFTQWLKTMKKIEATAKTDENEEKLELTQHANVVHMAEHSLVKNDILTENMVDVLVKQGKINEAISILQKLSLQDTAKSVYFASRIEHLKQH
jgi:hypothetical protein